MVIPACSSQLIWSNSEENDLLVLELLRNTGLPESLEAAIVSVECRA